MASFSALGLGFWVPQKHIARFAVIGLVFVYIVGLNLAIMLPSAAFVGPLLIQVPYYCLRAVIGLQLLFAAVLLYIWVVFC